MFRLYGALILLSLIWGLSFVFIKYLVDAVGVWGVVFLRCSAGALILLPILFIKGLPKMKALPWAALILVGLLNAGLPWGLIALSETKIQTNTASILNATTPIWASLVGYFFYSVNLSKKQWLGIITGFVGILILMNFDVGGLFGDQLIGVGTMLFAAISYGTASQIVRRHLNGVGVLVITTVTLITGALVGIVGMGATEGFSPAAIFNARSLISIFGLGVLGSGIAHLLYYYLINEGSPQLATSVTYLIPVTAMVWGYVLLGEPLSANLVLGLLVIFVGIYFSTKKSTGKQTLQHRKAV